MSLKKILKRTAFEVTFFIALIVLLPFHFIHAMILLAFEVCKHYPNAIYELVGNFYYGKDEEDS